MPVESVVLTGEAATGLILSAPEVATEHMRAVAELPQQVRLGRKPPRRPSERAHIPRLADFIDKLQYTPHASADWYTAAAVSIARMYRNDVKGCCVISGKGHDLGVWSANDPDSGGIVLCTDAEIDQQYSSVCGPGDNGCVITDVLDYMQKTGFTASGKKYKIDGYVEVDWTSKDLTKAAIEIFGAGTIGINLPSAWTSDAVWDVTNTGIVGGHDVSPCGHGKPAVITTTKEGVIIASWGRLYLITWEAWVSRKWLEEFYVMLPSFLWTGTDRKAPSGFDYDGLKSAMTALGQGRMPNDPTPPPTPPTPAPGSSMRVASSIWLDFPNTNAGTVGTVKGSCKVVGPVPATMGADPGADPRTIPWQVIVWLLQYGPAVWAIVQADLKLGKKWPEIIIDILAVFYPSPKSGEVLCESSGS